MSFYLHGVSFDVGFQPNEIQHNQTHRPPRRQPARPRRRPSLRSRPLMIRSATYRSSQTALERERERERLSLLSGYGCDFETRCACRSGGSSLLRSSGTGRERMASPEDSSLRLNRRFSPFVPRQRAQEPVATGRFFLCAIRPHGACRAADCEKPPGVTRNHRPLRASLFCFVGDAALFSAATAQKRHQLCMFYPKHERVLACGQIAVDSCNIACCSQHSVHEPISNQKDTFGSPKNFFQKFSQDKIRFYLHDVVFGITCPALRLITTRCVGSRAVSR